MRIAIALGDPNGIGPEVAIKAALAVRPGVRPLLVGDAFVIESTAERLKVDTPAFVDLAALDPRDLERLAGEVRKEIIAAAAETGGHFGAGLSIFRPSGRTLAALRWML